MIHSITPLRGPFKEKPVDLQTAAQVLAAWHQAQSGRWDQAAKRGLASLVWALSEWNFRLKNLEVQASHSWALTPLVSDFGPDSLY